MGRHQILRHAWDNIRDIFMAMRHVRWACSQYITVIIALDTLSNTAESGKTNN